MHIDSPKMPQPRRTYLSRRLVKEKADCPQCGKTMRISTLAWSHVCKGSHHTSEAVVQTRLAKMHEKAVQSFQQRMSGCTATQEGVASAESTRASMLSQTTSLVCKEELLNAENINFKEASRDGSKVTGGAG